MVGWHLRRVVAPIRAISTLPSRLAVEPATTALRDQSYDQTLKKVLCQLLEEIQQAGTWKKEFSITTPQAPEIKVEGTNRTVLNFCANNYLGLSNHPTVIKAAHRALDTHGFGLSSVRFICGTQDIHKELERKISEFHGTDDTILYPSCFDANAGLFESILTAEDAVLSDALNHASIIDGIRLCKAQRLRYAHMDLDDLEKKLQEAQGARVRLIATDGVFSMDGDIAPVADIVYLARKYKATTFIDECHSTGFMGKTGRGTDEHCGVLGQVDIINSTLGKALGGGTGGYTTGRREIIDMLRQKSRPYLFSNTLAPPVVGASLAVFDMLMASTKPRDKLEQNTMRFRNAMTKAGFAIRPGTHPIVPIMLGDAKLANTMAQRMLQEGVYVVGFSYPVVPKGQARIRVQLSAAHSDEQIDTAVAAFVKVGYACGVLQ